MALIREILAGWRAPRVATRHRLAAPKREDRALAWLMLGCAALFVARWPGLARAAAEAPEIPFEARILGALLGCVFLAPILFYALAGLSHLAARALGGQGSFYAARVALFAALLTISPAVLVQGLVEGYLGAGTVTAVTGFLLMMAFLAIWGAMLRVAEFERD